MMNIPPSEANALGLWEYEALIWNWNQLHKSEPDAPTYQETQAMIDALKAQPELLQGKPKGAGKSEPAKFNVNRRPSGE